MKNRRPFKLTWLLVPYNLAMAALNGYIAAKLLTASFRLRYSYICEPCRQKYDADELQIANAVWWYYFSKLLEFCDTFFFILRKKEEQLTFLHVYHHSTMFGFWWIGIKWVPSGSTFLPAMVNSAIHVLMYTYYGLSVFGPSVTKYLWWKKYLTILQLIQFTCALILGINGIRTGCEFPLWMHYMLIIYMISFIVLFGNFYMKAYIAKFVSRIRLQDQSMQRGVRQGDVISLKLLIAALEAVFNLLDWNRLGININGEYITQLRFAGDVVIMAETLGDLNTTLYDLSRVSRQVGLRMNMSKTKII
ncbi:jg7582 [Pararge aegeria aegeria]|uniref:Elongation of very long chain fatty acids protein n=1 Tax=Pararge aegeria aegeria TaxID=348720 RepID=A0A8S4SHH8_9NEOP|nr:jg7582 [Pararge aegeria aegeria]